MEEVGRWFVRLTALSALAVCVAAVSAACADSDTSVGDYGTPESQASQPASVIEGEHSQAGQEGRKLFTANCSMCHGDNASGTAQGPPLVHKIYEPGHHGNASFVIAVARGVRAHHWDFGNMPAIPELSIDEINQVICYVRELQLANDIIEEIPASTRC